MTARLRPGRRAVRGFTTIETLMVFAIVAILMGLAGPAFLSMIRAQRVKSTSFELFATLTFARSEALKRNGTVTITPNGGNWQNGWTVTDASAGTVLRSQNIVENISITGPASVSYNGMGRLAAAATAFGLTATNLESSSMRCISLELSGRPRVAAGACS